MYSSSTVKSAVRKIISGLGVILCLGLGATSIAHAYSCEAEFAAAQALVAEAEALVTDSTDSRILSMISEAKGIAEAGIVSHRKANEKHTGDTGKFMHGDSVRKGKWAQTLAKEALFLLTGEVK